MFYYKKTEGMMTVTFGFRVQEKIGYGNYGKLRTQATNALFSMAS